MWLEDLFEHIEYKYIKGSMDLEIEGIAYDSRKVKQGYLFVAIIGFEHDGHDFMDEAKRRGSRVVVVERDLEKIEGMTMIRVEDSREALASISSRFYHDPGQHIQLIGVTGTNGKTTTTYLIEAILRKASWTTGLMGTIGNRIGDMRLEAERTTPEALEIQDFLHRSLQEGVSHVVMEVSSHALQLKRVLGLSFNIAVYTNISQDHLDFHPSLTDYLHVKSTLFSSLQEEGVGVINRDDPHSTFIEDALTGEAITYGIEQEAQIMAQNITIGSQGASFLVKTSVGSINLNLQLSGLFNVYNSLAAIGVGLAYHIDLETIKEALEGIRGVAGRFELVDCGQDFGVIVDYAHSPDGMENILRTAKDLTSKESILVFGCGGERDRGKRPLMGKIAGKYCDFIIITSDNPRGEDPDTIISHIVEGLEEMATPKKKYRIIPHRREAITYAIERAKPGDIVFIIGKGHETYQILKEGTIPFDDREIAREALQMMKRKDR